MANEFIARNGVIALANSSISGSLTVSAGITGSFSGSLVGSASYATTANSASYALTASYVSGSSGSSISASYALTASFATNAVSASFFSGSISNAAFATSASYSATASYALNAGSSGGGTVGGQALLTQSLAATTWSFTHNLGTTYPVITVYDGASNSVIQPLNIVPSGSNNINIYFSSPKTGYATAVAGGGYFVTNNGTTRQLVQTTPSVTWSFAHNIGDQYPAFEIYDSNNNIVIPSNIRAVDAYTAEIQFAYSASGRAVATLGGGIGVGTVITTTSASSTWSLTHNLSTSYPIVTIWESGSNQIIQPDTITSVDTNTILVTFTTPVKGYANISRAGSVISGSSDWNLIINKPNVGVVYSQSLAASTWSINHNLGAQWPLVTVYDNTNAVVLPQTIVSNDANNLTITFPSPQSGYANISRAGNYISGSILWSQITNGPFSTTGSVTNFTGSALQLNGTNFVAGTLFGVSNQNSESISFNPAVSQSVGRILFFDNAAGTYTTARFTANNFDFQGPSNNTIMYISGSGRVNITGSVFVSGSLTVSGSGTLNNIGPANFTGSTYITGSAGVNTLLQVGNTTTPGLFVSASGNVGVGTTTTSGRLDVQAPNTSAFSYYFRNSNGGYGGGVYNTGAANTQLYLATSAGIENILLNSSGASYFNGGSVGIGTTSPIVTFQVSGSSDSLGRIVRFSNSLNSASIDLSHASNGGNFGYANIGSGNLSNVFFVTTGAGTVGSGIVMNNVGHVGFATSNVTESVQATGTISIITNSSVSSGPLIQFSGNGRIRPANAGDRLSIDGNALYLNSSIGGNIIANTAGGGFSIGRSDVPSTFNISGSTNGSTPLVDLRPSGTGAFLRGVRMLNPDMAAASSLMYAVGVADNSRNMGQFYFYYAGGGSVSNRLSMGLHSVDDVFNIFGSGNVVIGTTSDPGYKLSLNGQPGANGYTAWTNYSDIRLKENITDLDSTNVLSKISSLRPVTFNYNELSGYDEETRSRRISGFVAQELQEVFPEMVGTIKINDTEYYDTNTSNLQLYLVKAIQELTARVQELENK